MSKIKQQLQEDTKTALKNHDEARLLVLRGLSASINSKEIEKWTRLAKTGEKEKLEEASKLTEDEGIQVVFSEVKKRKEAIIEFEKGGRKDLVEKERKELEILQKYLPEQMPGDEIKKLAKEAIEKTGAKEMKDMGKVLGEMMPKVKGKAEGGSVSQIVKELLMLQK